MKVRILLHFLFVVGFFFYSFISFSQGRTFTRYDSLRGSLNNFRASFDVKYYDLHLKINIRQKTIAGFNTIVFSSLKNIDTIQIDLFSNLNIDSISFQGNRLKYTRDSNHVFIIFKESLKKNSTASLLFYYHGSPIPAVLPPWEGGFVWTLDSLKRPWIAVACEGVGASSWWPVKDHLSDEPDSVRLNFDIDSGLYCVSNGTLVDSTPLRNGYTRYSWKVNYPINSYNVTLNIGHYAHFTEEFKTDNQRVLPLDFYVLDTHFEIAKKHFKQVQQILKCFTNRFGPYPFPKDGYGLVETPYWGMEHQGAIAYGNHFINDLYGFDFIIVHETAHEWWGNSLSVSDHADMWIHEAFATYSESILVEDIYGSKQARDYLTIQKKKIKNEQAMLGPEGVNYNEWKDTDIYYKGAWMLHTFRNVLQNDSLWFSLLYHLNQKFRISTVSTKEIVKEIGDFTHTDYSSFFNAYLQCTRIPELEYYFTSQKNKLHLYYRWNCCINSFAIPLTILLNNKAQKINPSSEWQSLSIHETTLPSLSFREDLFYIGVKKINLNSH